MSVFKSDIRQLNFRSTILDQNDPKIFINEPLLQCAVSLKCCFFLAYKNFKTKEKSSWEIPKVLMVMVTYESFLWQSLSHKSNRVSQRWSWLELVAYQSGCKENFDFMYLIIP